MEKISFYSGRSIRAKLDFFLLSSALQKSVRRWMIDEALFYSREFLEAWQVNYLFKRLWVMLVEDIWVWNIYLGRYLNEKMKEFESFRNGDEINENIIYEIVTEFCNSPKNREADYFIVSYYKRYKSDDYLDSVLKRAMEFLFQFPFRDNNKNAELKTVIDYIATWKKLYEDAVILKKSEDFINEMFGTDSLRVRKFLSNILDIDFKNVIDKEVFEPYKEIFFKLSEVHWKDWLMLYITFFKLYERFWVKYDFSKEIPLDKNKNISFNIKDNITPPDYAYDKHTVKWKALWRWLEHFVKEWWVLKNEVVFDDNKYTKMFIDKVNSWEIKD